VVEKDLVFYLVARSYLASSAGVRAMHILCDRLNSFGFAAYLVPVDRNFKTSSQLNTPILTSELRTSFYKTKRVSIAVYDESIVGNPLKCSIGVHWFLNYSNLLLLDLKIARLNSEMRFVYAREIDPSAPRLYVNTIDYNFFVDTSPNQVRDISLFYAGKQRSQGVSVEKPVDTIEIFRSGPNKQSREELRDLFSRAKVLYLAEDSAMALEAAVCGCPTVFMKQYFVRDPLSQEDGQIGIAENDSDAALKSIDLSPAFIERYIATLELRTVHDVAAFALQVSSRASSLSEKRPPKSKFSFMAKLRLRMFKLKSAYLRSGISGILGVFSSHYNLKKSG